MRTIWIILNIYTYRKLFYIWHGLNGCYAPYMMYFINWLFLSCSGSRQFVEGSKHFAAQVFMESVDIEQYVNKVNFYEFLSQVVHVNSNDTIAGHLEFLNGIASTSAFNVVGNLRIISNMVNDVDLLRLFQEVLLVNGSQDIPGLLINGEMSMNDLRAFGLINGLNFSTDLVTRQGHQTLSGKSCRISLAYIMILLL